MAGTWKWLAWIGVPLLIVLTIMGAIAADPPNPAPPNRDEVNRLEIVIDIDQNGTLHITETYDWDFGYRQGLGFYRSLVTAQG